MIIPIKTPIIENASTMPKRYFGRHFADGIATYHKQNTVTYVSNEAARRMNKTFDGKPVFVYHNSQYKLEDLEKTADGYVVRSFFNPADGDHWCEFLVTTDKGHEAILKGWGLSNAYRPTAMGPGGTWQGNKYDEEILDGDYHHLAIVPDPRYESEVMTPERFKEYNDKLNADLEKVTNSLGDKMKFNLFKKDVVENSKDFGNILVELPKTKRTLTIENALEELDEKKENSEEFVKLQGMYDNAMKKNSEMEKELAEYKKNSKGKKNESDEDEEEKKKAAKENEDDEEEKKKKAAKENSLHDHIVKENSVSSQVNSRVYTSASALENGKARYSK